jgi:hypothetical protein
MYMQVPIVYLLNYYRSSLKCIHRGYYTAARRYDFYFRVVKTIFYERAQRGSKILFLITREDKSHIFKPPCDILYVYSCDWTIDILYTRDSASVLVKLKPRIFQRLLHLNRWRPCWYSSHALANKRLKNNNNFHHLNSLKMYLE